MRSYMHGRYTAAYCTLSNGCNMPMSEVFQLVRAEYESKPPPEKVFGPGYAKVVARNEKWFITELLDKWRVDHERRKLHHHTGYFALNHLPYKSFANLKHIEVYDLLGDHLGILVNRQYAFMQLYSRNQPVAEQAEPVKDAELHNTIVVVCEDVNKKNKLLPPSKTGGLSAIRATLNLDNRVLRDVAAGGPLRVAFLHKENEKSSIKKEEKSITEQHLLEASPDGYFIPTDDGSSTNATANTAARQTEGSTRYSSETMKGGGPNLYVALAAAHFKSHTSADANKPGLCQLKETVAFKHQQHRNTMAKLKSVYAILCYLHNIKSRDLKSQEPLSYSTVKALAFKPLHSLAKNLPHLYQHHLHAEVHHHPSSSPYLPHRQSLPVHHRGQMASRHIKLDGPWPECVSLPAVETWEELLQLHKESGKQLSASSSSFVAAVGGSQVHRPPHRIGSSTTHTNQKSHRVLPPWQNQILFVKNKSESLKRDPAKKLQDCIGLFHQFKSEISQQVKSTLEDREDQQHLMKHLLTKVEHLKLGANMDVCLEKMREQAYFVQSQEKAEECNKPTWFSLLEKEVKVTFDLQDKEGNTMIEKLKQFTQIDVDGIPHVIEKMCLLIMSLPANQLSIQPVMAAIEFVLEHILKQSPKLLNQLKNLRQLPSMTTRLASAPVYVFGHRV